MKFFGPIWGGVVNICKVGAVEGSGLGVYGVSVNDEKMMFFEIKTF